jgi:hypothetical protein
MEIDANVVTKWTCLISNIKKEVCVGLDFFFKFLKKHETKPIICYLDVEPHV